MPNMERTRKFQLRRLMGRLRAYFSKPANVILLIFLVVWKLFLGRRRYRYGRSVGRRNRSSYRGRRRH